MILHSQVKTLVVWMWCACFKKIIIIRVIIIRIKNVFLFYSIFGLYEQLTFDFYSNKNYNKKILKSDDQLKKSKKKRPINTSKIKKKTNK